MSSDTDSLLGRLVVDMGLLTADQVQIYLGDVSAGRRPPGSLIGLLQQTGRAGPQQLDELRRRYMAASNGTNGTNGARGSGAPGSGARVMNAGGHGLDPGTEADIQRLIAAGVLNEGSAEQLRIALAGWLGQGHTIAIKDAVAHLRLADPATVDQALAAASPAVGHDFVSPVSPGNEDRPSGFFGSDREDVTNTIMPTDYTAGAAAPPPDLADVTNTVMPTDYGTPGAPPVAAPTPANPFQSTAGAPSPFGAPAPASPFQSTTPQSATPFDGGSVAGPPSFAGATPFDAGGSVAGATPFDAGGSVAGPASFGGAPSFAPLAQPAAAPTPSFGASPATGYSPTAAPAPAVPVAKAVPVESPKPKPAPKPKSESDAGGPKSGREKTAKDRRDKRKKRGRRKKSVPIVPIAVGLFGLVLALGVVLIFLVMPTRQARRRYEQAADEARTGKLLEALSTLDSIDPGFVPDEAPVLRNEIRSKLNNRTAKAVEKIETAANEERLDDARKLYRDALEEAHPDDRDRVKQTLKIIEAAETCLRARRLAGEDKFIEALRIVRALKEETLTEQNSKIVEDILVLHRSFVRREQKAILAAARQGNRRRAEDMIADLRRRCDDEVKSQVENIRRDVQQAIEDYERRKRESNVGNKLRQYLERNDVLGLLNAIKQLPPAQQRTREVQQLQQTAVKSLQNRFTTVMQRVVALLQQKQDAQAEKALSGLSMGNGSWVVIQQAKGPDGRPGQRIAIMPEAQARPFMLQQLEAIKEQLKQRGRR